MNEHEMLHRLQQTWPETTDYLQRVGQVTNDQMVVRELQRQDQYEASETWLDRLAVGVEDLTRRPLAVSVMRELASDGILIRTANQVKDYQELVEEHEAEEIEVHGKVTTDLLERTHPPLPEWIDDPLWELPELQERLIEWGQQTATRHGWEGQVSLGQAAILFQVCEVLSWEPEQSPAWAAECLQSALSEPFFLKAETPTR